MRSRPVKQSPSPCRYAWRMDDATEQLRQDYCERSQLLAEEGLHDENVRLLEVASRMFGECEELAGRHASALLLAGRREEAITAVERMVTLDPEDPWTLLNAAHLIFKLDPQAALRYAVATFARVDEEWERMPELGMLVARLAKRVGLSDDAEEIMLAILEAESDDPDLALEIAEFYEHERRPLDALRICALGLAAHPGHAELSAARARAQKALGG